MNIIRNQKGLVSTEMAIVAGAFFVIILGALEVSRLLFTWNTLDAITQRAVRVATVCPPNHNAVKQIAMFGTPGNPTNLLDGFSENNLQLSYLNSVFSDSGGALATTSYVRAKIVNYQIQLNIPFISNIGFTSPPFTAVVPRESLGYVPDTESFTCFGTA